MILEPSIKPAADYLTVAERARFDDLGRRLTELYRNRMEVTAEIKKLQSRRRSLDARARGRQRYAEVDGPQRMRASRAAAKGGAA